jgi:hypothetical protein
MLSDPTTCQLMMGNDRQCWHRRDVQLGAGKLITYKRRSSGESNVKHRDAEGAADEAQVSPLQEMGAAQDDLCAGSSFAILEATSAGW